MISVIIPVYNLEKYIEETLDSVLRQNVPDIEIILVDDRSTDNTVSVIEKYCEAHPDADIRLLKSEGKLMAWGARNLGVEKSYGRYVAFLDGDDLWMEGKLRGQIAFMEKTDCAFSFTGYEFADENATPMGKIVKVPETITYAQALRNTTIFTSTVIFDTEKIPREEIVFPSIKSEDTALWFKVLRKGYKACGLNENLTLYRRTGNSLSSDKKDAARRIWNLYRISEKLPLFYSCFCFIGWGFNAVKRRI